MRLKDKVAVVIGAGQGPGEGMGNGRATCIRFVQEGAKVLAVDNRLASAQETAAMASPEGGACIAFEADVTREASMAVTTDCSFSGSPFRNRTFLRICGNGSKQWHTSLTGLPCCLTIIWDPCR